MVNRTTFRAKGP